MTSSDNTIHCVLCHVDSPLPPTAEDGHQFPEEVKTELHFLYPETESSPDVLSTNLKHHVGLGMRLHILAELVSFPDLAWEWDWDWTTWDWSQVLDDLNSSGRKGN